MSVRGYYAIARGYLSDPMFAAEPFTEREAFQWLIEQASFGDRKYRVGRKVFDLKRGQLAASCEYMRAAWKWKNKSRVQRILRRWEVHGALQLQSQREATLITLCNYEKYQGVSNTERNAESNVAATPLERYCNESEELKQLKELEIDGGGGTRATDPKPASNPTTTPNGHLPAWRRALDLIFPEETEARLRFTSQHGRFAQWLANGWDLDLDILPTVARLMVGRAHDPPGSLKYFEKAIARARAERLAPISVENPEQAHVVPFQRSRRSDLQLAIDKARDFAARGDQQHAAVSEDTPSGGHQGRNADC